MKPVVPPSVPSAPPSPISSTAWIRQLEEEILAHPAVHHSFLKRFAREKLTAAQMRAYAVQHYHLIRVFPTYMTQLQARLVPELPETEELLRPVFDDEFGQHSIFLSHVHLHRRFLTGLGMEEAEWGRAPRLPSTQKYILEHLRLTREGDPLAALGAIGPAHEIAIPPMFRYLLEGIRRNTALPEEALEYYTMHITEDVEHARLFNLLLEKAAPTHPEQVRVREGAMFSLGLRFEFWSGLEEAVFG